MAINCCEISSYKPIPGRLNVAFLQAEYQKMYDPSLGWPYWDECRKADLVVTSCLNSKKIIQEYYDGPIEICPLGISDKFTYFKRTPPKQNEPFVFLFENAFHKGGLILRDAWRQWSVSGRGRPGNAILMMKLSGEPNGKQAVIEGEQLVIDNSIYTADEMVELYESAHAFINVSYGDGFGLSQVQAMRSGLVCTWPHYSAITDYADESMGYPMKKFVMEGILAGPAWQRRSMGNGSVSSYSEILEKMDYIYRHYEQSLVMGKTGSAITEQFTWENAGLRFKKILDNFSQSSNQKLKAILAEISLT